MIEGKILLGSARLSHRFAFLAPIVKPVRRRPTLLGPTAAERQPSGARGWTFGQDASLTQRPVKAHAGRSAGEMQSCWLDNTVLVGPVYILHSKVRLQQNMFHRMLYQEFTSSCTLHWPTLRPISICRAKRFAREVAAFGFAAVGQKTSGKRCAHNCQTSKTRVRAELDIRTLIDDVNPQIFDSICRSKASDSARTRRQARCLASQFGQNASLTC